MAWGKNRRRPHGEPQDIARSIQQSAVRVRVWLQLSAAEDEAASLRDLLTQFEHKFETRLSLAVTQRRDVRVELLECGLNSWQHLVELQRVLMGLKRPTEQLTTKTTLRHDPKYDEWTLSLAFMKVSEDALWRFATTLMLRLQSSGVLSKVLLAPRRLTVPLESTFVEWRDMDIDKYQWEGQQVCSQVVVNVSGDDIQRVFLPPIRELKDPIAELRYPELVSIVDDMLSGNSDVRKPVVVILRGIPGSGKSTLGREIEAICRHRGVEFTACSADFFFETIRGYVFDAKKLGAAHSKCKSDFTRALEGDIPRNHGRRPHQHVVLVDNTSTQRWEYEPYENIARSHGSHVHIVEMACIDALMAFRMGQRNSHGVPPDKVVSMFMRWEEDPRAYCFTPQFEHARLTANPLSDGDVGGITYVGLFLDDESQQKMLEKIPITHPTKLADHVTLCYRPNKQYTREAELGAAFAVRGVEIVQDGSGQTLRVELDDRLPMQVKNKIPHITISTKNGVSASYSNDLLENASAKRTMLDPPIELTARLGAALFVQNQRVITTSSPFAADVNCALGVDTSRTNSGKERKPDKTTSRASRLFIWYVRESDVISDADETATKFLWRAQILHHMGSQLEARRLLCIQKSQLSSSSSILSSLQDSFFHSLTHCFDDLSVIPQSPSFQEFEDVINKYVSGTGLGPINQFTLMTSVEEPVQWPLCEINSFQGASLSVVRVSHQNNALQSIPALSPPCSTILSALDLLRINIHEEARSTIFTGVCAVGDAWARASGTDDRYAVRRIDTSLPGLSSRIIELCLPLPSTTAPSDMETLKLKLLIALEDTPSVQHVVRSCVPGQFYFCLNTASSYTPNFCVRMAIQSQSSGSTDTGALSQLKLCEHQLRASREMCDVEAYSVLVAVIRAILLRGCSNLLPRRCRLSSLTNLVSERLVLRYLDSIVDGRPTAEDVTSGHIICALYSMLSYLSRLSSEEWTAAFGDSLLALQGSEKAQIAWRQAMENVMQSCTSVMASHRYVGDGSKHASPSNPRDHLRVLVALVTANIAGAVSASPTRTYVEMSSRSTWSPLHALAWCDKLRSAAAMVLPQDDDEHNGDSPEFFSCAPSLVARRVDVTSSSLDLLRSVIKKLHTLEGTEHDSDGALSGDYVIRRAETDEVLSDLNRSS